MITAGIIICLCELYAICVLHGKYCSDLSDSVDEFLARASIEDVWLFICHSTMLRYGLMLATMGRLFNV